MANNVTVDIKGKNEQLKSATAESESVLNQFGTKAVAGFAAVGVAIAAAFSIQQIQAWGKALIDFTLDAFKAASEAESAMAKLEAVTRATGGTSGVTSEQISQLASEIQNLTKIEDDNVIAAAGVLSIYQNISGESFPRTLRLAADMSELFGGDLTNAVRTLGKALDSPKEGMTALTRIGVRLDEQTIKLIESLAEVGETAKAQEIIFAALEGKFMGLAESMGETTEGRIARLKNRFGEMQEEIGTRLLPILEDLTPLMDTVATGFEEMISSIEGDIDISGVQSLQNEMITLIAQTKTYLDVLKQISVEGSLRGALQGASDSIFGQSSFGKGAAAGAAAGLGTLFSPPDVADITAENERSIRLSIELKRKNNERLKAEREQARQDSKIEADKIRQEELEADKQFADEQARFDAWRAEGEAIQAELNEKEKEKKKKDVKEKAKKEDKDKPKDDDENKEFTSSIEGLEQLHSRIQSAAASGRKEEKLVNKFAEMFEPPIMELVAVEEELIATIESLDETIKTDLAEVLKNTEKKDESLISYLKTNVQLSEQISKYLGESVGVQKDIEKAAQETAAQIDNVGRLF